MTINLSLIKQLWTRLGERTRLIIVGVLAFVIGMFWGGRSTPEGSNGRYVPWATGGTPALLDTRTGEIWRLNESSHRFERVASLPYF